MNIESAAPCINVGNENIPDTTLNTETTLNLSFNNY